MGSVFHVLFYLYTFTSIKHNAAGIHNAVDAILNILLEKLHLCVVMFITQQSCKVKHIFIYFIYGISELTSGQNKCNVLMFLFLHFRTIISVIKGSYYNKQSILNLNVRNNEISILSRGTIKLIQDVKHCADYELYKQLYNFIETQKHARCHCIHFHLIVTYHYSYMEVCFCIFVQNGNLTN